MRRTTTGEPDPQGLVCEEKDTVRLAYLGEWEEGTGRPVEEHARRHPRHAGALLDCAVGALELSGPPAEGSPLVETEAPPGSAAAERMR